MVEVELYHAASTLACEQGPLHHQSCQDRHQDSDQVEGEDHVLSQMWEENGGEEHIDWQPRAAGHKGIHEDGELHSRSFPGRRSHNGGHIAAEAHD